MQRYSLRGAAATSLPSVPERDHDAMSLDSLPSFRSLESLDTLPSFASVASTPRFLSPRRASATQPPRSRRKGAERAKENRDGNSNEAFSSPTKLFKRTASPASASRGREGNGAPSPPRDGRANGGGGVDPTTPSLPPQAVAARPGRPPLFSPLTPASAKKGPPVVVAQKEAIVPSAHDSADPVFATRQTPYEIFRHRTPIKYKLEMDTDSIQTNDNSGIAQQKLFSETKQETNSGDDPTGHSTGIATPLQSTGITTPSPTSAARFRQSATHMIHTLEERSKSVDARRKRRASQPKAKGKGATNAEGGGPPDASESAARPVAATAHVAAGGAPSAVAAEETADEEADDDGGRDRPCLWCPAPLLTWSRRAAGSAASAVVPVPPPDAAAAGRAGTGTGTPRGLLADALRPELAALRERARRSADGARGDALLAEVRAIERALVKIASL